MDDGFSQAVEHGGSLKRAEALFPHAPRPFVDLSTGINPHPYPFFDLPASTLTRLPEPARTQELNHAAALFYGAPSAKHIAAGPGTQIFLPLIYGLVPRGKAAVLGPTYQEHALAAGVVGHDVTEVEEFESLFEVDLAVVVNPNNPDGRVVSRDDLLALAKAMRRKGGLLVVDEAFMEVGPQSESVTADVEAGGLVVLRSFGKFYGLAGVRLGFALAEYRIANRLNDLVGPWAVSGPALEYGLAAFADRVWQEATLLRLAADAMRLDSALELVDLHPGQGTLLYRHVRTPRASAIFERLGRHGIFVRRFPDRPDELRFGLPASDADWRRLECAMGEIGKD